MKKFKEMALKIKSDEERKTVLNALNFYGNHCLDSFYFYAQNGSKIYHGPKPTTKEVKRIKQRSDLCFLLQERVCKQEVSK